MFSFLVSCFLVHSHPLRLSSHCLFLSAPLRVHSLVLFFLHPTHLIYVYGFSCHVFTTLHYLSEIHVIYPMVCWDDWCMPRETHSFWTLWDSIQDGKKEITWFLSWVTFLGLNQGLVGYLNGQAHQDSMQWHKMMVTWVSLHFQASLKLNKNVWLIQVLWAMKGSDVSKLSCVREGEEEPVQDSSYNCHVVLKV